MSQPTKKTWTKKPYNRIPPAPVAEWNPGNEVLEIDRALAMDRALIMSQLFQAEYFEQIIQIINGSKDQGQFNKVCTAANITDTTQQKWLWNYLKNYDPTINWGGTGW